jgi:NADH-quinone oxidoreductase subunit L
MGRLLFLTFFGTCRAASEAQHHVHEAPATMALPLLVLAVLSAVGGFLPVPRVLEPVLGGAGPEAPLGLDVLGAALGLGGLALAWVFYVAGPDLPARARAALGGFATLVAEKFRIDELYDRVVVGPIFALAELAARGIDPLIDGLVTSPALLTRATSGAWRRLQTGNVQHYAFSFLAGALVLVGWYVLRR